MGQQQLLLIVLGVILVGVAVVLGIQYFGVGAEEGAKDELVAHSLTIGANAQQWYKKPLAMGGGGGIFTGFAAYYGARLTKLHTTPNSEPSPNGYAVTETAVNILTILALPKATQNYTFTNVTTIVTPDGMTTTIN